MISYSTNLMGPVSTHWYEKNNVPMIETEHTYSKLIPEKEGQTYISRQPSINYACGRIDIYGLDEEEYWCGKHEYGVGVMKQESWNILSDYLDDFESPELLTYEQLIEGFEKDTRHKIEWFDEKEENNDDNA